MFDNLIAQFATLIGFAALVSVVINILKMVGVVKDGTADKWIAGFNLAGLIALAVAKMFIPSFDAGGVDTQLGAIAQVAAYILSYVGMLLGSKLTYTATRGLPVVGKSNSETQPVG